MFNELFKFVLVIKYVYKLLNSYLIRIKKELKLIKIISIKFS